MEKARSKSTSPIPSHGIRKSQSSSSVLDEILRQKGRSSSPSVGYGLADSYRKPPPRLPILTVQTPHSHAFTAHITTTKQGIERERSPLIPVPLTKSASAPMEHGDDGRYGWYLDSDEPGATNEAGSTSAAAAGNSSSLPETAWACKGCPNTDTNLLEYGPDSFLVCVSCGCVDSSKMVEGDRQKNCPRQEDKTTVADAPVRDIHVANMESWANGPEASNDRRRRHINASGGTRMQVSAMSKNGFMNAQGKVDTQAARDTREILEGNTRDARKRRAILIMIEHVLSQLDNMDQRIKRHIRQEANRIYSASLRHEAICKVANCQLSLSNRTNSLVGICTVQSVVETLCYHHNELSHEGVSPVSTLSNIHTIAPEVSKIELRKTLAAVKQLNLTNQGSVQRLSVSSAIGIVSQWKEHQVCQTCGEPEPPPPPMLRLPASMVSTPESCGRATAVDPGDVTFKLRDRIIAAAEITGTRADIRNRALVAIASPSILKFLTSTTHTIDVIALCLLAATAHGLKLENPTTNVAIGVCATANISSNTLSLFTKEVGVVLEKTVLETMVSEDLF